MKYALFVGIWAFLTFWFGAVNECLTEKFMFGDVVAFSGALTLLLYL